MEVAIYEQDVFQDSPTSTCARNVRGAIRVTIESALQVLVCREDVLVNKTRKKIVPLEVSCGKKKRGNRALVGTTF